VLEVEVFISCGDEVAALRDVGNSVLKSLQHMLLYNMRVQVTILNWDYRMAPPTVVPKGGLAGLSLSMVERSQALIAIFGKELPPVTREEIRKAFALRRAGKSVEVYVFINPALKTGEHDTFLKNIEVDFGEKVVYTHYNDSLEFQGKLFITLMPFILKRIGDAGIPLLGGWP
jgi:hypothetical protein